MKQHLTPAECDALWEKAKGINKTSWHYTYAQLVADHIIAKTKKQLANKQRLS